MSKSSSSSSGAGFASLLGLAFIILKLTHVIDWRWIWVLAPFWIGAIVTIVIVLFIIILAVILGNRS